MRSLRCIMRRYCWIVVCFLFGALSSRSGQTTAGPDIRSLMIKLSDIATTDRAAAQILEVANKDAVAREYVVHKLPEMIIKTEIDQVWVNAVMLAGKLKASEAIPSLLQAMSHPPFPASPYISLTKEMHLENDIVAKVISEIGDSAIPAVEDLLKSADAGTRSRAVLILRNMGSPAARKVLGDRLPHETDPGIKKLIQNGLRS
jgi:HEAT repeat protein